MIGAGLDIGSLWTKSVIVKDQRITGWSVTPTGDNCEKAAKNSLNEALKTTGIPSDKIRAIVITGAGKGSVDLIGEQKTEIVCMAEGSRFFYPDTGGVIDMGGESTRVVKLDDKGNVLEFALNDKCASGTGIFLDEISSVLGVEVEDMGPLSLKSNVEINITSTCVVFAESEVVSLVARQTPKEDILRGVHRSIATRVFGLVNRVEPGGRKMVTGGLALNTGIVACLEEMINEKLTVPENPQIISALGAAVIAAGKAGA